MADKDIVRSGIMPATTRPEPHVPAPDNALPGMKFNSPQELSGTYPLANPTAPIDEPVSKGNK